MTDNSLSLVLPLEIQDRILDLVLYVDRIIVISTRWRLHDVLDNDRPDTRVLAVSVQPLSLGLRFAC